MNNSSIKIKNLTITGLLIALVYVATRFIQFHLPISINGGLTHAGTFLLFTIAFVFGKRKAAISGALGMALSDITSPWTAWAPFTFIVRAVMGYMAGAIVFNKNSCSDSAGKFTVKCVIAIILSGIWMCAGYYVAEGLLYGNWITPVASIPGNLLQLIIGIFSIPMSVALKKAKIDRYV